MKIFDNDNRSIYISYVESKMINFAINELIYSLNTLGYKAKLSNDITSCDIIILYNIEDAKLLGMDIPSNIDKQGFQILQKRIGDRNRYYVLSSGEQGAMYGVFEFAETILNNNGHFNISPQINNPVCEFRAIKINLPWSSYREGKSLEIHKQTLKDINFWEKFLNMMMKNRFNALTIWCLHPFSFMIKPKNFPLATPYNDNELNEWKKLWSSIFRMAKERGIETYIINWNIFVSESFKKNYDQNAVSEYDGHYAPYTYYSDIVNKYLSECLTQLIDEYEDLTGFGISLGERMVGMTPESRQKWVEDVYFKAVDKAKRKIKFIHRAAFSISPEVTRKSIERSNLPKPVYVEMKFNWSHAYSTTDLLVTHGGSNGMSGYWEPKPTNYKMVWTARNEDFFTLRWAQSDFIREHIKKNNYDYVAGYIVGSECFIPAYDYSHKKDSQHINWKYSFQKNWLYYMLWGRLLYNPDVSDDIFINHLARLYSKKVGKNLFYAYSHACKMPMILATFHNFGSDYTLYSEGFMSTEYMLGYNNGEAFISIKDLCECKPIDPKWLSVKEYVDLIVNNEIIPKNLITPLQLSDKLNKNADIAEAYLSNLKIDNQSLECEVLDVKAWICLNRYFSDKLKAAISYQMYKTTKETVYKEQAIEYLDKPNALKHWSDLVEITNRHYVPQPLIHIEDTLFSWEMLYDQAKKDIQIVMDTE